QIIYDCLVSIKEKLEEQISTENYDPEVSQKLSFIQQWLDESDFPIPNHITHEWYNEVYLKSEHWRKKRIEALDYAKRLCQLCNSDELVNVHHRSYENLGHEHTSDLTVLCKTCHKTFHTIVEDLLMEKRNENYR
ncbi:unnamed protein product, partial [marine sediment metagenome]